MASFTDKVPQFNPYVAQLPVDAMVKVGMQKQQQYNEGIQKIQANVDKISGLDVGREVDKAYLQSKVNEVGNSLKTFMAADFSDAQLVNSTASITNSVSNDPFVRAAVYSTANDKKQMEEMEKDRQKGTLTPHAEYFYQTKRNKYYNNPNLKNNQGGAITFSDKYVPSWDLDKNILEAIKAVGDSKWTADNVFKMDPNGNIIKDKNGAPVYSEYAIREIRAGKFSENITAAIDSVLTRPEARQELSMRGIYNYRNYNSIDDFIESYENQKQKGLVMLDERKLNLLSQITTETNPLKIKQYQAMINKIDGEINSLENSSDVRITEAEGFDTVEAYKASLETQKVRNSYKTAYTTEQYSKEYIESIPYKVAQEKIKMERDWWAQQQNISQGWANIDLSKQRLKLEQTKWDNDPKNPKNKIPEQTTDFITLPVSSHDLYADFLNKGEQLSEQMTTDKRQFVVDYLMAINNGNGKSLTTEEINRSINSWLQKDPSFIDRYYEKGKKDVTDHPENTYFSNLITTLPKLVKLEKDVYFHGQQVNDINNDPRVIEAGGKQVDFKTIENKLGSYTIDYLDPNSGFLGFGQSTTSKKVTPSDIINISIVNSYRFKPTNTKAQNALYEEAYRQLETKFNMPGDKVGSKLIEGMSRKYGGAMGTIGYQSLKENANPGARFLNDLRKAGETIQSEQFSKSLLAKEAVLKEKGLGNAPLITPVYIKDAKEAEIKSAKDRMNTVLNTFKEGDMNVSEFKELMKANKEYSTSIKIDRDQNQFGLALYDGEQLIKEVPLTKPQVDFIKGTNVKIPQTASAVLKQISWSGEKGTTNFNGSNPNDPAAYQNAYYPSTYFFETFNRTDVLGADIKMNGMGQPNLYLYVKSGNSVKGIPVKMNNGDIYPYNFDNVDQAEQFLKTLSTSGQIDNIINNSKPKK